MRGRRGCSGRGRGPVQLAGAVAPFAAQTLSVDGQWHSWTSGMFAAAAKIINAPASDTGSSDMTTTRTHPGAGTTGSRAGPAGGASAGAHDDVYTIPSFYGP